MREAWLTAAITKDAAVNVPSKTVDLSTLTPLEIAFAKAVRDHLAAIAPWWVR